jgi:hypothetical protein
VLALGELPLPTPPRMDGVWPRIAPPLPRELKFGFAISDLQTLIASREARASYNTLTHERLPLRAGGDKRRSLGVTSSAAWSGCSASLR